MADTVSRSPRRVRSGRSETRPGTAAAASLDRRAVVEVADDRGEPVGVDVGPALGEAVHVGHDRGRHQVLALRVELAGERHRAEGTALDRRPTVGPAAATRDSVSVQSSTAGAPVRPGSPTTAAATTRRSGVTRSSARARRRVARKGARPRLSVVPVATRAPRRITQIASLAQGQADERRAQEDDERRARRCRRPAAVGRDGRADDDQHAQEDRHRRGAPGSLAGGDLDGEGLAERGRRGRPTTITSPPTAVPSAVSTAVRSSGSPASPSQADVATTVTEGAEREARATVPTDDAGERLDEQEAPQPGAVDAAQPGQPDLLAPGGGELGTDARHRDRAEQEQGRGEQLGGAGGRGEAEHADGAADDHRGHRHEGRQGPRRLQAPRRRRVIPPPAGCSHQVALVEREVEVAGLDDRGVVGGDDDDRTAGGLLAQLG